MFHHPVKGHRLAEPFFPDLSSRSTHGDAVAGPFLQDGLKILDLIFGDPDAERFPWGPLERHPLV